MVSEELLAPPEEPARIMREKEDALAAISSLVHSLRVARAHARPAQISRTVLALTPNSGATALQCIMAPRQSCPGLLSCGRSMKISSARAAVSCRLCCRLPSEALSAGVGLFCPASPVPDIDTSGVWEGLFELFRGVQEPS